MAYCAMRGRKECVRTWKKGNNAIIFSSAHGDRKKVFKDVKAGNNAIVCMERGRKEHQKTGSNVDVHEEKAGKEHWSTWKKEKIVIVVFSSMHRGERRAMRIWEQKQYYYLSALGFTGREKSNSLRDM